MGEIFPPYICTHGPGEDPFEAVMCAVGAASQLKLLIEDFCFVYKTSLESQQDFIPKESYEIGIAL